MSEGDNRVVTERSRWWALLLIASLGLNFLAGGIVAAGYFWPERAARFAAPTYTQLLPRKFLGDLAPERRRELLGLLKTYRDGFRQGRGELNAAALRLAEALSAEPHDGAAIKAAVDGFAAAGNEMIAGGSAAALDLISRLTPAERAALAERIAERARRVK